MHINMGRGESILCWSNFLVFIHHAASSPFCCFPSRLLNRENNTPLILKRKKITKSKFLHDLSYCLSVLLLRKDTLTKVNSYKRKHLVEGWLTESEVQFIIMVRNMPTHRQTGGWRSSTELHPDPLTKRGRDTGLCVGPGTNDTLLTQQGHAP